MKIEIADKYESWRGWLTELPETFEQTGKIIYNERNQIRLIEAPEGTMLCVKRYHKPLLINKFVYKYLRPSKARRAFENGLYLMAHGVGTPEPIAYIEEYEFGGLGYSYLITRQSELKRLNREFTMRYKPELDETIRPLARFTAKMHNEGILHEDFSPGNILWDKVDGEYKFEIIDINRMSFGSVDIKAGCRSVQRICARRYFFDVFADEYAKARGLDKEECRKWIHYYRDQFWHNGKKANYQYD